MKIQSHEKHWYRDRNPIHKPEDGRGYRRVYLNGRELKNVVFVNTRKGKVVVCRMKVDKHQKRVLLKTVYGSVKVEFID